MLVFVTIINIKWEMIIAVIYATFAVWKRKPDKKISLVRDSSPWPLRYRCSALPIKLIKKPSGSRSLNWFVINPWKDDDEVMNVWKSCNTAEWIIKWRLSFRNCKSCVITAMIILHLILHSAVRIYDFHMFINRGYYTVARRYEFYVRVTRTISHEWDIVLATKT